MGSAWHHDRASRRGSAGGRALAGDDPPIDGLAAAGYWTNREATTLTHVPESAIVLGRRTGGRRARTDAWALRHYAALAIKADLPLSLLRDTVAQFTTYTEAYLKAIEQLDV